MSIEELIKLHEKRMEAEASETEAIVLSIRESTSPLISTVCCDCEEPGAVVHAFGEVWHLNCLERVLDEMDNVRFFPNDHTHN